MSVNISKKLEYNYHTAEGKLKAVIETASLKESDLFIVGSNKFIDYTTILISWKKYEKSIKEIDKPTTLC